MVVARQTKKPPTPPTPSIPAAQLQIKGGIPRSKLPVRAPYEAPDTSASP